MSGEQGKTEIMFLISNKVLLIMKFNSLTVKTKLGVNLTGSVKVLLLLGSLFGLPAPWFYNGNNMKKHPL